MVSEQIEPGVTRMWAGDRGAKWRERDGSFQVLSTLNEWQLSIHPSAKSFLRSVKKYPQNYPGFRQTYPPPDAPVTPAEQVARLEQERDRLNERLAEFDAWAKKLAMDGDRSALLARIADLETRWNRVTGWIPVKGAWLPPPNVAVQLRMVAPADEPDFTTLAYIHRATGRWVSVDGGAELDQSRVVGWRHLLPLDAGRDEPKLRRRWRVPVWIPAKGAWLPLPEKRVEVKVQKPEDPKPKVMFAHIEHRGGKWRCDVTGEQIAFEHVIEWRRPMPLDVEKREVTA